MVRTNVAAMGTRVDVLEWHGDIVELMLFSPDTIHGVDEQGVAHTGSMLMGINRVIHPGDLLVLPAGRPGVSPLHFFRDSEWVEILGLVETNS